jgi:hypothetical protein
MKLREWLWWPTAPTHAAACGLAFVIVTFLGIVEAPRYPSFKDFTAVQASAAVFFGMSFLIAASNACFLFLHARGDYLTAASGMRPIGFTFAFLTVAFPLAWGTYRIFGKGAPIPDVQALASGAALWLRGGALPSAASLEWTRVTRAIFVGEGGLAMVLLFSGLWKAPPQDTLDLAGAWSRTRPLLRRVFRDGPFLDTDEHKRLQALLTLLDESGTKLDTRALLQDDLAYAKRLAAAARTVLAAVRGPHGALENLRQTTNQPLLGDVRLLLGERDP